MSTSFLSLPMELVDLIVNVACYPIVRVPAFTVDAVEESIELDRERRRILLNLCRVHPRLLHSSRRQLYQYQIYLLDETTADLFLRTVRDLEQIREYVARTSVLWIVSLQDDLIKDLVKYLPMVEEIYMKESPRGLDKELKMELLSPFSHLSTLGLSAAQVWANPTGVFPRLTHLTLASRADVYYDDGSDRMHSNNPPYHYYSSYCHRHLPRLSPSVFPVLSHLTLDKCPEGDDFDLEWGEAPRPCLLHLTLRGVDLPDVPSALHDFPETAFLTIELSQILAGYQYGDHAQEFINAILSSPITHIHALRAGGRAKWEGKVEGYRVLTQLVRTHNILEEITIEEYLVFPDMVKDSMVLKILMKAEDCERLTKEWEDGMVELREACSIANVALIEM